MNDEPKSFRRGARTATVLRRAWWLLVLLLLPATLALAEQRFPPPEFEGGHQLPETTTPPARAWLLEYLDIAVLAASLGVATWLIYRQRSRKGLIGLSLFSIAYFGFYRKGCVCAIGSIQNVALALFDTGYALPVSALVFFLLPLVFALFAGRSFCCGRMPARRPAGPRPAQAGQSPLVAGARPQHFAVRFSGCGCFVCRDWKCLPVLPV